MRDRLHQAVGLFADLAGSANKHPDGRFWVSELQSGPTLLSGVFPYEPSAADIRLWTWQSIASGAKAVVYWCFNSRRFGVEAGEWGLLDLRSNPTARLDAARETAETLARHDLLFAGSRPPAPDVYILWPRLSMLLGWRAGEGMDAKNPRNRNMAADAACGAYLMCSDLGLQPVFVTEDLRERRMPQGAVLIAAGAHALEPQDTEALLRHAEQGGARSSPTACAACMARVGQWGLKAGRVWTAFSAGRF